jgi:hypothetical protein
MTIDLDKDTADAIAALVHRLKNRGDSEGQYATDDDLFALEYLTAMRGRGWRPTEVRAPWEVRTGPAGCGHPESAEAVREVEAARQVLDEIRTRQHEERRRLAVAEPPAGAA